MKLKILLFFLLLTSMSFAQQVKVEVDTTNMGIEEVIQTIINLYNKKKSEL